MNKRRLQPRQTKSYLTPSNDPDSGYYKLVGTIILLAIQDYKDHSKYTETYKEAKDFLFVGRNLENFLERFHIDHIFSASFLRRAIENEVNWMPDGWHNENKTFELEPELEEVYK